ncbi:MAG: hypothetical protein C0592_13830 [Marinilabiliales bacterium]|nr:MAG: hypothetical protein C0592_13830 [Marinilabiliales bacterium]
MKHNFRKGDKVRFLNTTGSGVIARVTSDGVIYVNIGDGFEIPCEDRDLVLIDSDESASKVFSKKGEFESVQTFVSEEPEEEIIEAEPVEKKVYQGLKPEKGLYYLLVPQDEEMPVSCNYDAYLVNYSAMELYIRFMVTSSKGLDRTLKTGVMEPGDAILISEVKQTERNEWLKGKIQFLAVDKKTEKIYPSELAHFQIKEQKLINEAHFRENAFFDEIALMQTVFEFKNLSEDKHKAAEEIEALKESLGAVKKEPRKRINTTLIDKHIKEEGFAEVDLHIDKLRGDYKSLRDNEKISTQMSYFSQCLDSAIGKGLKKVVFIHGVGSGILKERIRKILDEHENLKYEDASLLKYGEGATEVIFN